MHNSKSNILTKALGKLLKSAKYKIKSAKKKPTDCILIIDIASTCWKDAAEQCASNPKQQHEILEIAITPIILKDLSIEDTDTYIIKPRQSNSISELCTKITGLTDEICNDGIDIEDAFVAIKKSYKNKGVCLIATFGLYDLKMIRYQCSKLDLDYPFPSGFMDLRRLCSMTLGLDSGVSLGDAMRASGLTYDKRLPKRAGLDGRRAARLVARLWSKARPKVKAFVGDVIIPDRIVMVN